MSRPTTLYRFFNATGELLYVGIAGNPGRRFEQHAKEKLWWSEVSTTRLEHHPSREAALIAETRAIVDEHPRYNRTHNTHRPEAPNPDHLIIICSGCHRPIADRDGYIETLQRGDDFVPWRAWHRACDPDTDSCSYWFAVERCRTYEQLEDWDRHLHGKVWIHRTDWEFVVNTITDGRMTFDAELAGL